MLFEYAVEPKAIGSNWQSFRYLIEKFGFDRGRLISRFPKTWVSDVYSASKDFKDIERHRVVEALNQAKKRKLIRSGRPYNPSSGNWLDNAITQQATAPFHAIIATENPTARDDVVLVGDVEESHPLIASSHDCQVPRVGTSLAYAMAPLLRAASTVLFVDRYFDISQPRYRETLKACFDVIAANGGQPSCCEIHFGDNDRRAPAEFIERQAHKWLNGVIPPSMSIKLYAWRERTTGEDFHARDLLTDIGGMNVESGFSAEGAHQSVRVTLLSEAQTNQGLATFARDAMVYELVKPVLHIHSDGTVERLV